MSHNLADLHLTPQQADAFLLGTLDEEEGVAIEGHLRVCGRCADVLSGLEARSSWTDLVRQAAATVSPHPTHLASQPDPDPAVTAADRYVLLEPIGHGGFGVVYRARQASLDRVVALKLLRAGPDADPAERRRFQFEAEAAARLRHPGIVPTFEVGTHDGQPCIAMEFVEGESLASRLAQGPLEPAVAAALVRDLALALAHAHEQGVLHRDIKPSNILLDRDGRPRIVDFGLAKRLDLEVKHTGTGVLLGTPGYMAPEQASGEEVGPWSDIHALGAVLYEALSGRPPFHAPTALATIDQLLHGDAPSLRRVQPSVPRDLATICETCLRKEKHWRYSSAAALADDLERFLAGQAIAARRAGVPERMVKWIRREPARAALVAVLIASASAAAAGLAEHTRRLRQEVERTRKAGLEIERQRAVAQTRYRTARATLQHILEWPEDPRFAAMPLRVELHRQQLEQARGFYDRVLSEADPRDPSLRLDTAQANREAANVLIALGRHEEAEPLLRKALALVSRPGTGLEEARERLVILVKLGVLLVDSRVDEAILALEKAASLAEEFDGLDHHSSDSRSKWAWSEHNLGSALQLADRKTEARQHYVRSEQVRRAIMADEPARTEHGIELAATLVNLATIDAERGELDRAEALYSEADRFLRVASEGTNAKLETAATRAELLNNRGNLAASRGQTDLALACFEQGLALVDPVLADDPGLARFRQAALNLHGARGLLLGALGRHAEAASDWDGVLVNCDRADRRDGYELLRALARARAGDHVRAMGEARALHERVGVRLAPADLYNLACVGSLAAGAASGQVSGTTAPGTRSDPYCHEALDWLDQAVARGLLADPAMQAQIHADSDLSALRKTNAFHEWVARLEPTQPPGPETQRPAPTDASPRAVPPGGAPLRIPR